MARATDFTKMTTLGRVEERWQGVNESFYLIKFQRVEQIVQLPVLANFLQFDVMLLQAMKGQLCLIIDKDFKGLYGPLKERTRVAKEPHTFAMNFLHVTRMSFANVALNIITCL